MGLFFRGASEVCRGLLVGHWGGKSQHELDKPWILTNFLLSSILCCHYESKYLGILDLVYSRYIKPV